MVTQQGHRFRALDGWRGVCAVLVALHHIPLDGHFYAFPLVANAYLFVDFFFVLSGFVITHSYVDRVAQPGGFSDFAIRRFGRLWPLHAVILLGFVGLELAKGVAAYGYGLQVDRPPFSFPYPPGGILASLLLIQSLGLYPAPVWNNPSWSISTEFYTYLIFAVAVIGAGYGVGPGRMRERTRALSSVALVVAIGAAAIVMLRSDQGMDVTTIFRCIYGFFVGHLTYRVWQSRSAGIRHATLLELVTTGLALGFVAAAGRSPLSFAAPIVFAAVVLVFAHQRGRLSRFMTTTVIAALGAWSYSIYMIHAFIYRALVYAVQAATNNELIATVRAHGFWSETEIVRLPSPFAGDIAALALLLVVCAAAWVTYNGIERPGQALVNRWAARLRQRSGVPTKERAVP